MRPSPKLRALARLAPVVSALALLQALPVRATEPIHSQATPTSADTRGGLLLLSFLVPLPIPLLLVAPPSASRPPEPVQQASHQRSAQPARGERMARRAAGN